MPIATDAFTALGLLIATLYAFQNLVRYAKAKNLDGVVGILLAALTGCAVVALAAHSDVTAALHLIKGAPQLGNLDGGSQILLGVSVGSAGTVVADLRKAIDNTTTAEKPPIVGPYRAERSARIGRRVRVRKNVLRWARSQLRLLGEWPRFGGAALFSRPVVASVRPSW